MTCISSTKKARLEARLVIIRTQISEAETALSSALSNGVIESYTFDSGEGRQQTKNRNLKQLTDILDHLYATEDSILKRLSGTGLVNINIRRHIGRNFGGRRW